MPKHCLRRGCVEQVASRSARLCGACRRANYFDPAKLSAHTEVARARRKGLLADPRTLKCTDCAAPAIEYDHREYAKPLQVDPVCRRCNLARGPAVDSAARDTSLIQPTRRPAKPQAGKGV